MALPFDLHPSSDDFDVLRRDLGRSIGRHVVPAPQRSQIVVERLPAGVVQRQVSPVGRAVVLDEEVDRFGWRERIGERLHVARDSEILDAMAEAFATSGFIA